MEKIIDNLINDFEKGKMSRRQLIQTLTVAAASTMAIPALGAETAPRKMVATGINHISYGVADYGKARDFYADLLGMKLTLDDGKQAHFAFGNTLLMIRKTRQPNNKPYVDHIAYTIANWDDAGVEAELRRRGLDPRLDTGGGINSYHVKDVDGFDVQLAPALDKSKL